MPDQLQLRGGTTTEHNSFTGALREVTVDTTKKTLVVHDGSQAGGTPLMKESGTVDPTTITIGTGGTQRLEITNSEVVFNQTGASVDFRVEGDTEPNLLFVDASADQVSIGTSSPSDVFDVVHAGNTAAGISIRNTNNSQGSAFAQLLVSGGDNAKGRVKIEANGAFHTIDEDNNGHLIIEDNGTEKIRLDSSGHLKLYCTAQPSTTVAGSQFDNGGASLRISRGGGTSQTTGAGLSVIGGGSSTNIAAAASYGATLNLINSNNTDGNSNAVLFLGSNSLATSSIVGETTSHANRNGELAFLTSSAAAPAERMRIDSTGDVGIGMAASGIRLDVQSGGNDIARFSGQNSGNVTIRNDTSHELQLHTGPSDALIFGTGGENERMRIDNAGRLIIGTTAAANNEKVRIAGRTVDGSSTTIDLDGTGTSGPLLEMRSSSSAANDLAVLVLNQASLKSAIGCGRANTNNWGTDLRFFTHKTSTSDQHQSYERMRIDASGLVSIGTSSGAPQAPLDLRRDNPTNGRLAAFGSNGTPCTAQAAGLTNAVCIFRTRKTIAANSTEGLVSGYGGSLVLITILFSSGDNVQKTRLLTHAWSGQTELFSNSYGTVSPTITFSTASGILKVNHQHNGNLVFNCAGFIITGPHTG